MGFSKAGWLESNPITDPGVLAVKALIDAAQDERLVFNDPTFIAAAQAGTYGTQWQEVTAHAPTLAGIQSGSVVEYARPASGISGFIQSDLFGGLVKKAVVGGSGWLGAIFANRMAASASTPSPPPPALTQAQVDTYYTTPRSSTMFEDAGGWNWGNILQTGVNAFTEYQRSRQAAAPMAMPGGMPVQMASVAFPALGALPALGGMMSRALPAVLGGVVGGAVVRGGRMIATAIGNISRKRVVAIAKTLGIQGAATALGIGAVELAQMVLNEQAHKRRGGGVTGAQLRTTRKTMRKVMGMARTIRSACSETGFLKRSSPRHHHHQPAPRVIITKR